MENLTTKRFHLNKKNRKGDKDYVKESKQYHD